MPRCLLDARMHRSILLSSYVKRSNRLLWPFVDSYLLQELYRYRISLQDLLDFSWHIFCFKLCLSFLKIAWVTMCEEYRRRLFDPETLSLPRDFVLTKFAERKGWGCKVGQDKLTSWLEGIGDGRMLTEDSPDVSLIPIGAEGGQCERIYLASTTDFFSPISLDPYNQGRIACANTLSDLYAIGAHRVDTMLMILSVSTKMEEEHRDIVTRKMIEGFNDACKEAGTKVSGGQTVFNPWPILGGCASTTLIEHEIIRADGLQSGDVLVLTKPLGSQIAANLALWIGDEAKWRKASTVIDLDTATRAVQKLVDLIYYVNVCLLWNSFDSS